MFNIVSCIKFIIYNVLKNDLEKFHFCFEWFFLKSIFISFIDNFAMRKEGDTQNMIYFPLLNN